MMRALAFTIALLACGCPSRLPVCSTPRQLLDDDQVVRPPTWYRLLVNRGLDGAACDCTGITIEWHAPSACRESEAPTPPLPQAPFSASDLVTSRVGADEQLVWVITQRFRDGAALGPVALVRERHHVPEVLVTGSLRAGPKEAHLSLVTLGQQRFLAADGQSCASDKPTICRRSTVLFAERDGRFVPATFVDDLGACIGPAELYQARSHVVSRSSSRLRLELSSTWSFGPDRILVEESMTVSDFEPGKEGSPRLERRADAQRIVRASGGQLVVNDRSLWSRVVEQNGGK